MIRILEESGLARVAVGTTIASLITPTYFPAISSTSSSSTPKWLLSLLSENQYPRVLVSALDLDKFFDGPGPSPPELLRAIRKNKGVVILDSGVFESQVHRISDWHREDYRRVADTFPCDIEMSFDGMDDRRPGDGSPVVSQVSRGDGRAVVEIVHGGTRSGMLSCVERLLKTEARMAGVAIPDRECGATLLDRVRTIASVRRLLNGRDKSLLLHVLGCGSPVAMAAYVRCGADSFDSLDWCQAAIDVRTFSFTDPILLRYALCTCAACQKVPGGDTQRAYLHNLVFYQRFADQLRQMIRARTIRDFLVSTTSLDAAAEIDKLAA